MFVVAKLTDAQIRAIQQFEKEEGIRLIAMTEMEVEPEMIEADKLTDLQRLEEQLGVCLVAVHG
jgi:hypothetical protein